MRAYFFGNMYLSSIQQGIQAGHVIGEMAVKYCPGPDGYTELGEMFYDWAQNHKTMILLNGGYGENIHALDAFFEGIEDLADSIVWPYDGYSPYPFATFSESSEALDGAITCTGIILPPKIYKGAEAMRKIKRLRRDDDVRIAWEVQKVLTVYLEDGKPPVDIAYDDFEVDLMTRLSTFRMAS